MNNCNGKELVDDSCIILNEANEIQLGECNICIKVGDIYIKGDQNPLKKIVKIGEGSFGHVFLFSNGSQELVVKSFIEAKEYDNEAKASVNLKNKSIDCVIPSVFTELQINDLEKKGGFVIMPKYTELGQQVKYIAYNCSLSLKDKLLKLLNYFEQLLSNHSKINISKLRYEDVKPNNFFYFKEKIFFGDIGTFELGSMVRSTSYPQMFTRLLINTLYCNYMVVYDENDSYNKNFKYLIDLFGDKNTNKEYKLDEIFKMLYESHERNSNDLETSALNELKASIDNFIKEINIMEDSKSGKCDITEGDHIKLYNFFKDDPSGKIMYPPEMTNFELNDNLIYEITSITSSFTSDGNIKSYNIIVNGETKVINDSNFMLLNIYLKKKYTEIILNLFVKILKKLEEIKYYVLYDGEIEQRNVENVKWDLDDIKEILDLISKDMLEKVGKDNDLLNKRQKSFLIKQILEIKLYGQKIYINKDLINNLVDVIKSKCYKLKIEAILNSRYLFLIENELSILPPIEGLKKELELNYDYIKMLENEIAKLNPPFSSTISNVIVTGGSKQNIFLKKYLKYKAKYMKLKKAM